MTYEEFCKVPIGAVIIDDNGYDYIMGGDERLWPSNPNEPFSVIRHHKFSFEGFRNATEEETKAFFDKSSVITLLVVSTSDNHNRKRLPAVP